MTKTWVGTSWKMHKTLAEALGFVETLEKTEPSPNPELVRFIVPAFTAVREVKARLSHTDILVGAQNMHWEEEGAWTGEVSPRMLTECSLDMVEIGHSERRQFFNETDETVGLKVAAAIRHGLVPVICIGESLRVREAGKADDFLANQVRAALSSVEAPDRSAELVFAYEPIWAIGENGIPATAEYAADRHQRIAAVAGDVLGREIPVIYGGSVNPGNCADLIAQPSINGLFIGRSAWNAEGFLDILTRVARVLDDRQGILSGHSRNE